MNPTALQLKVRDGIAITVPASLSAITTYVLLEQEEWFEKEVNFLRRFLKPGMVAIDIGANLGVYSLLMAHQIGAGGSVFAYEPSSQTSAMLERSKQINAFGNLEIMNFALSNDRRQSHLAFADSSELRALGPAGSGESVEVTTLDLQNAEQHWSSVDFIKIDAEGEEERIIAGGHDFFATHSPLVMFEIKAGAKTNERLRTIFPTIGYRLFRQLAGEPILVPDDPSHPLDDYELNLFAAKPDCVRALASSGLLVDRIDLDFKENFSDHYEHALCAFATWRGSQQPVTVRCAALASALKNIRAACAQRCTAERASTWARISWEWGSRAESVAALRRLLKLLGESRPTLSEPYWSAASRFDNIAANNRSLEWLTLAAAEQHERSFGFSSLFSGPSPFLSWLCSQAFCATDLVRRQILILARAGQRPRVPERLCVQSSDHLNSDVWRAGMVPGTTV